MMPASGQVRQKRALSETVIPTGMTTTVGASDAGRGEAYGDLEALRRRPRRQSGIMERDGKLA
jgi:hypothetical protein